MKMDTNTCIFLCKCGAGIQSDEGSDRISDFVGGLNADVFELHDLCALALNEKEFLNSSGKRYEKKIIIACYPRAVNALFSQNEIEFGHFEVLNFRENSAAGIEDKLENEHHIPRGQARHHVVESALNVPAWYPIVDESRCSVCGRCAKFCLFGVYQYDGKSLEVVDPLACKNNCPACGRNCPDSAIIFPKVSENSYLSGAESIKSETEADDKIGLDGLRARIRGRKSIFKSEFVQKAEEERRKALEELVKKERDEQ